MLKKHVEQPYSAKNSLQDKKSMKIATIIVKNQKEIIFLTKTARSKFFVNCGSS